MVWEQNDDREPCRALFEKFRDSGRVCMAPDCNATELKGSIARCRFLVAARTHASIAGYSSCVPTLVLGYSVKSRGIARDLFGTEEGYVLPVQALKSGHGLAEAFRRMAQQEHEIRTALEEIMPRYRQRAEAGASELNKLVR